MDNEFITYLGCPIKIYYRHGYYIFFALGKSFISDDYGKSLELASTYIENSILTQKSL